MKITRNAILGLTCSLLSLTSWQTYAIDNGVYTITSNYSGKLVEVGSASTTDGANISQWPANGHDTQKWLVTATDDGYYSLVNLNSGKSMEVYNYDTNDGANVSQWEYWGGDSQKWEINDLGNNQYYLINKHSGKALDLLGYDTSNGANIGLWSYWGGDAQKWTLSKIANIEASPWDPSTTNGAINHWPLTGNLVTHDPTIGYEDGTWWIFQTGDGILGKWSTDGIHWEGAAPIFPNGLSWWQNYVPEHNGIDVWAPELKQYNGRTWLYYSISTFGSRVSAIGLASATSVATGDWQDEGLVVNTTNSDNYNAIDPDLVLDKNGAPWLVFGSWNSGIKLKRINPITMKPYGSLYSLASRSGGLKRLPLFIVRAIIIYLLHSANVVLAQIAPTELHMAERQIFAALT
ncbi:RICIN domain-containing protein [Catenovulum sediminis]|uniref:RICIN domain-containing protein n=1 Tax=Catenovulum sediminis TaxID=1740262 RepID=UPI0024831D45|nr:RICIN domain-containing protein [Catenovulum sediminis]